MMFLSQDADGKHQIRSDCAQWFLNLVADMFPASRGLLTIEEVDRLQAATIDANCWEDDEIAKWEAPEKTAHALRCFGFRSTWVRDEDAAEHEPVKRHAAKMLDEVLKNR